jgi:hypothetical protein
MIFRDKTESLSDQHNRRSSALAPLSSDSAACVPLRAEREIAMSRDQSAEWCSAPEFCLFTNRFDFEPPPSAA